MLNEKLLLMAAIGLQKTFSTTLPEDLQKEMSLTNNWRRQPQRFPLNNKRIRKPTPCPGPWRMETTPTNWKPETTQTRELTPQKYRRERSWEWYIIQVWTSFSRQEKREDGPSHTYETKSWNPNDGDWRLKVNTTYCMGMKIQISES